MKRSLWLALWCLCACGSDSTTGHPVALQTALRAEVAPFVTKGGWTVELTKAAISLGGLYYFDGEPAFVRRASPRRWLAGALGLGTARAHPGHYLAGTALGQMIIPAFADLLAGTTMLPDGNGLSGDYRSARIKLGVPGAESALAGHVAMAEGVARRGTQQVHFQLRASYDDVTRSANEGEVDGCVFEEADVQTDGTVTVSVLPHVWFNLVDFASMEPGTASAPTQPPAGSTPRIAFALGVTQLSAYRFSFTPRVP